jgi:hypothetical protein
MQRLFSTQVIIFKCLIADHLTGHRRDSQRNLIRAIRAANQLIAGSDSLTSAVRAYAATFRMS